MKKEKRGQQTKQKCTQGLMTKEKADQNYKGQQEPPSPQIHKKDKKKWSTTGAASS